MAMLPILQYGSAAAIGEAAYMYMLIEKQNNKNV